VPHLDAIGPGGDFAPPLYTGLDFRLFVFAFGAALAAGVLTALFPALRSTRWNVFPQLRETAGTAGAGGHVVRSALVVVQVAASCVVLTVTGLALRSLHNLARAPLGFEPRNLLLATYDLGLQRYGPGDGWRFHARLLEKVRALPGVRDASLADHVPFDVGGFFSGGITAEGKPADPDEQFRFIPCIAAERAFLATTGFRVVEGRDFSSSDDAAGPRVAIINQLLARHLWPDESPLGRRLMFQGRPVEVVGVVGQARYWSITDRARPLIFRPLAQQYNGRVTLVVRTASDSAQWVSSVRQVVRSLDPDLPLHDVRTMDQQIASSPLGLMPLRVGTLVGGAQGTIALFLATLGIFGLVSFTVTRRTHEIGVRMAMGARTIDVVRLVARQSLRLTVIGLAIGLTLALALTRTLARLLYEVSPTDIVVLGGTAVVVLVMTALACWVPARRAAEVDPMVALRCE
jgi:predicted permease